jgi:hypothetical protein
VKTYVLVKDKLYKQGATSNVLMKCVSREDDNDILDDIHKEICDNHASSQTIMSKACRAVLYLPTTLVDVEKLV